ncbi:hypothetical protein ACJO5Y_15110 [Marinobacter sp. GN3S48]|uniref:hypothetical protein n=1 Tax=Marinobacter sp. GN3S48 TaxID=3382302 RepID=UPI00387B4859
MIKDEWLFIVGCQRCATTSLVNFLGSFGKAYLPYPIRPERKPLLSKNWESEIINAGKEGFVNIDKATSYIEYPEVSELIASNFDNYRVIISIRNPIDRAISNYFFSVENGLENRPIEEALFSKPDKDYGSVSVNPYEYINRGFYCDFIEKFLKGIEWDRCKIVVAEEFIKDISYRKSISTWAGLEEGDNVFPHKNSAINSKVSVEKKIREQLFEIYWKENIKLEKTLGIDLSIWYE